MAARCGRFRIYGSTVASFMTAVSGRMAARRAASAALLASACSLQCASHARRAAASRRRRYTAYATNAITKAAPIEIRIKANPKPLHCGDTRHWEKAVGRAPPHDSTHPKRMDTL